MMDNRRYFISQNILKTKNNYWIISSTTNAIWKCDFSFNIIDYLIFEEENVTEDLFRAVVCVDEMIYLFPFNARNSYLLDTQTNSISKLNIDLSSFETKNRMFSYAFVINKEIIVVGRSIRGFLKYDLSTEKAKFVADGWMFNGEYICSFTHAAVRERAYTASVTDGTIVEFDLKNDRITCYDFSKYCSNSLRTILTDEEFIYVTNDMGEILKLDDSLSVLDVRKIEGWDDVIRLAGIEKDRIWLVGNTYGRLLIEKNGRTRIINLDVDVDSRYGYCFTFAESLERKLLLQSRKTGEIICFDFENELQKNVCISASNDLIKRYLSDLMNSYFDRGETIEENKDFTLEKYIEMI